MSDFKKYVLGDSNNSLSKQVGLYLGVRPKNFPILDK